MYHMQSPRAAFRERARRLFVLGSAFTLSLTVTLYAQWTSVGPYAKTVRAVIQAPDNPSVFFAGAFGWGVFKSTDGGTTWTNYQAGLTNTYVRSLSARSSQVLLCGTNDNIARSTDGGVNWTVVQPTAFSVRGLAYDPATGHWYAGTYGDDFYRSTDDGVTWSKHLVSDPISGQTLSHIRVVARFGADSIYAGGSIGDIASGLGGALFVSYDGGNTWKQIQESSPAVRSSVTDIAVSPNVPATSLIFGTAAKGVYKTTDGGLTLLNIDADGQPSPLGDTGISATAFSPAFRIAATDSVCGVFLRALGDTLFGWEKATGLPGPPYTPWALASYGGGAGLLAGLEQKGMYRSLDSGRTFAAANSGLTETDVRDFAFGSSGRVIAATGFGDELYYSDNDGATWIHAAAPSANSVFALSKSATGVLYAAQYATGVLKSTDNGATWAQTDTAVINRFVRAVGCDPFNTATVYAGTGNGVFKSTTAGAAWADANAGTIPFSTSIRSLAVSPLVPGLVLAGTDVDYLYRSTDGGASWSHRDNASGFLSQDAFVRTIVFDPLLSTRVYTGADSGRVYRSMDGGATWGLLATLPGGNSVRQIAIDPADTSRLFAATFGSGIFVTEDGGAHWSAYSTGLGDLQVSTLALRPQSSPLQAWAGSGHRGAYRTVYTGPAVNQKPILTGPAASSVTAGGAFSLKYVASDPDLADTIQFSMTGPGLLTWAPRVSPDTAGFTWTTTAADTLASPYTLRVIAVDPAGLADTVTTELSVYSALGFKVGDANMDGAITSADIIYVVNYVFKGGPAPKPVPASADVNCDATVNSSDIIFLVNYVFKGGAAPACG